VIVRVRRPGADSRHGFRGRSIGDETLSK
jgi:hypothetical protein